jgi:predicted nuclease of restriction endonuclease-like (RecB) superfamily
MARSPKNALTSLAAGYPEFLGELKTRIQSARLSAARAVNRELILLYWDLGRGIVEKQRELGWGKAVVETLGRDLQKAFPKTTGFSGRNLWYMRQFFEAYSSPEFLQQAVAEIKTDDMATTPLGEMRQAVADIPWGHHVIILDKVPSIHARLYYLRATARFGWSRNVLLNQIKAGAYERTRAEGKTHNFPAALPERLAEQAEEALKSSYNLEFLGIGREVKERDLEARLLNKLRDFILELGYGFCFIGNQYRLALGKKEYFIDLLFYHRFLKSLVAVELKVGAFEPEFAGKMDFYLNLLNDRERAPDDNPSIGIILCAEKDALEVEFSLKTKANPIGVAEYQLVPRLPRELKGKLPTARQLSDALQWPAGKKDE